MNKTIAVLFNRRALKIGLNLIFAFGLLLSLLQGGSPARAANLALSSNAESVVRWNGIALRTAITVARQFQTQSEIYISYEQAAVYDAVVNIEGGYRPYNLRLAQHPGASVDAAVATAAYQVLVTYFSAQQTALESDYMASLAAIPDGPAKSEGIAVGQLAANSLIALRQDDGREADIGFTVPAPAPGVWQPPTGQGPQTPWVSKMRPFMLLSPDQFRPGPPPDLTSSEWATEYNEVKLMGRSDSPYRTPEQTDVARFWSTNAIIQYNTAYQQVSQAKGLSAVQAARLFAMGNLIGADALIACFDAKYEYLFWRPQYAIPLGNTDGNPNTVGDPSWTSLLPTPNHPEYISAHGCLTSAEAEVFSAFLGTDQIKLTLTSTIANLQHSTRYYDRARDLVKEIINARVWGGLHYRESMVKGTNVGRKVALWSLDHYFQPIN
jgi:hypothetical protein